MFVYINTYTNMHMYIYIHIRTHTHTHIHTAAGAEEQRCQNSKKLEIAVSENCRLQTALNEVCMCVRVRVCLCVYARVYGFWEGGGKPHI